MSLRGSNGVLLLVVVALLFSALLTITQATCSPDCGVGGDCLGSNDVTVDNYCSCSGLFTGSGCEDSVVSSQTWIYVLIGVLVSVNVVSFALLLHVQVYKLGWFRTRVKAMLPCNRFDPGSKQARRFSFWATVMVAVLSLTYWIWNPLSIRGQEWAGLERLLFALISDSVSVALYMLTRSVALSFAISESRAKTAKKAMRPQLFLVTGMPVLTLILHSLPFFGVTTVAAVDQAWGVCYASFMAYTASKFWTTGTKTLAILQEPRFGTFVPRMAKKLRVMAVLFSVHGGVTVVFVGALSASHFSNVLYPIWVGYTCCFSTLIGGILSHYWYFFFVDQEKKRAKQRALAMAAPQPRKSFIMHPPPSARPTAKEIRKYSIARALGVNSTTSLPGSILGKSFDSTASPEPTITLPVPVLVTSSEPPAPQDALESSSPASSDARMPEQIFTQASSGSMASGGSAGSTPRMGVETPVGESAHSSPLSGARNVENSSRPSTSNASEMTSPLSLAPVRAPAKMAEPAPSTPPSLPPLKTQMFLEMVEDIMEDDEGFEEGQYGLGRIDATEYGQGHDDCGDDDADLEGSHATTSSHRVISKRRPSGLSLGPYDGQKTSPRRVQKGKNAWTLSPQHSTVSEANTRVVDAVEFEFERDPVKGVPFGLGLNDQAALHELTTVEPTPGIPFGLPIDAAERSGDGAGVEPDVTDVPLTPVSGLTHSLAHAHSWRNVKSSDTPGVPRTLPGLGIAKRGSATDGPPPALHNPW